MMLTLEILNVRASATRVWLQPGQSATFGRTRHADYLVPDGLMSRVHFRVRCEPAEGRLEDLQSHNGTFVNGSRVRETVLHDGDEVRAGQTIVRVRIDPPLPAGRSDATAEAAGPPGTSPDAQDRVRQSPSAVPPVGAVRCPSGIHAYHAGDEGPAGLAMMRSLAERWPLHLILAAGKIETPPPAAPFQPVPLYDWIPARMAPRLSPLLIAADPVDLFPIAERTWGQNALVCVYSELPSRELLAHLRRAARGQHAARAIPQPQHMFLSCQPSGLNATLKESTPEFAGFVFSKIAAILLESNCFPPWELLAGKAFAEPAPFG